jgi:hypothetical protein
MTLHDLVAVCKSSKVVNLVPTNVVLLKLKRVAVQNNSRHSEHAVVISTFATNAALPNV